MDRPIRLELALYDVAINHDGLGLLGITAGHAHETKRLIHTVLIEIVDQESFDREVPVVDRWCNKLAFNDSCRMDCSTDGDAGRSWDGFWISIEFSTASSDDVRGRKKINTRSWTGTLRSISVKKPMVGGIVLGRSISDGVEENHKREWVRWTLVFISFPLFFLPEKATIEGLHIKNIRHLILNKPWPTAHWSTNLVYPSI